MTINDQLDLDAIEARKEAATKGPWMATTDEGTPVVYVNRTSPKGVTYSSVLWNADWATEADAEFTAHAREDVDQLVAEVRRLRARLADEERQHGQTIDDRDRFHEMADQLAHAVAPEEIIGEHSSMNCPWENALDVITPMAEVEKLREELERQTGLAEQGARANQELKKARARIAELEATSVPDETEYGIRMPGSRDVWPRKEFRSGHWEKVLADGATLLQRVIRRTPWTETPTECPGFEGTPVDPSLCAGCGEPSDDHPAARSAAV